MGKFAISRFSRSVYLLAVGLTLLSAALPVMLANLYGLSAVVEEELSQFWRPYYDILVRPPKSRSPIENNYGLVEPNFLTSIKGGISFRQYDVIRSIPEVEIAAPVAVIGEAVGVVDPAVPIPKEGLARWEASLVVDRGPFQEDWGYARGYVYYSPNISYSPNILGPLSYAGDVILSPPGLFRIAHLPIPLLMVGVDPEQEARLVGLEKALTYGRYFPADVPPRQRVWEAIGSQEPVTDTRVPVLINNTPYVVFTSTLRISLLELPSGITAEEIAQLGREQLDALPIRETFEDVLTSAEASRRLIETWLDLSTPPFSRTLRLGSIDRPTIPPPRNLQLGTSPPGWTGLTLEVAPTSEPTEKQDRQDFPLIEVQGVGVFQIERIPPPTDLNWVPLEIYFPPVATLRYDENGRPISPTLLLPSPSFRDLFVPRPALLLTTLEGARLIRGDNCISAIRVRVKGIDKISSETVRKIEAVASEIHRRTGLDVDIMVGSSPRRILVHVPGIGYVEEQWVQKGVTVAYQRRIHSGHLLILASLLTIGGLFTADMAWADLLHHQRRIAIQKAVGWRSSTVLKGVLGQSLWVGLLAGAAGTALGCAAVALAGWPLPSPHWLVGVPLMITLLSLAGSLYPALEAVKLPPVGVLQMRGVRHQRRRSLPPGRGKGVFLRYAADGVLRRWSRSVLALLAGGLSAALLALLVGVVTGRAGYLSGTLLGEYILLRIEAYHWWLVAVGFGLAAVGIGNSLLSGVLERRQEIGVLKAVGWRTGAVMGLFLAEGALLGLAGGLAGTALGLGVYLALYREFGVGLLGAAAAGLAVPVGVGMLAALYPARVAARVPPAEAVRAE